MSIPFNESSQVRLNIVAILYFVLVSEGAMRRLAARGIIYQHIWQPRSDQRDRHFELLT